MTSHKTPSSGNGRAHDPIGEFERMHALLLNLCDTLESIADYIPETGGQSLAAHAAMRLRRELPLLHVHEEEILFPVLIKRASQDGYIERVLADFADEHTLDEGYSQEVLEVLDQLASGRPLANREMAGYLLRGFFMSFRRHLRWEEAIVLKMAHELLTEEDLEELSRRMAQHEQPS